MNWIGNQIEGWVDHGVGGLGICLEGIATFNCSFILEAASEVGVWCIATGMAILLTPFAILHVLLERGTDNVV